MSDLEFKGACYACESVAETNIKLQKRIDELEGLLREACSEIMKDTTTGEFDYWRCDFIRKPIIQEILKGG